MVKPKSRIARKPAIPPKAEDNWVNSGGVDPEIQAPEPASLAVPPNAIEATPKAKPFPHRISLDTTTEQYKRLKKAAFDEEQSLNDIIRDAVEQWLQARNY